MASGCCRRFLFQRPTPATLNFEAPATVLYVSVLEMIASCTAVRFKVCTSQRTLPNSVSWQSLEQRFANAVPNFSGRAVAHILLCPRNVKLTDRTKSRIKVALRIFLLLAGIAVVVKLAYDVGSARLTELLTRSLPYLPIVLLLEFIRLWLDARASYWALSKEGRNQIPFKIIFRAQLVGTAVGNITPTGRSAEEATKATLMAPWVGAGDAASAAATNQAATLIATGLISIPCTVAAWAVTGFSWITIALVVHTVALVAAGALVRGAMRSSTLRDWLKRRSSKIANAADDFQRAAKNRQFLPYRPIGLLFTQRLVQTAQYGILGIVIGVDMDVIKTFVFEGLYMLSQVVGNFVPSQIGVTEGLFVIAAGALQTTQPKSIAIALLAHLAQGVVILVGSLTPFVWKAEKPNNRSQARRSDHAA